MSDIVGFKSKVSGKFVCADLGQGGLLIANRDKYHAWEQFRFIPLSKGGEDDRVVIQSIASGKYVAVEIGGRLQLTASRDAVGPWEIFHLRIIEPATLNSEGRFALRSAENGCWVCAEQGQDGILRANRGWVHEWEEFCFATNGLS